MAAHSPNKKWFHRSNDTYAEGGGISSIHGHLVAASGEFVGTFFFLWMGYSGHLMAVNQAASVAIMGGASSETVVFVSIIYSFSLLVNAWAFYRISGGLFNPAVTIGLSLSCQLSWLRAVFLIPAQIIASICAGELVNAMFPGAIITANTILAPGTSVTHGLFIEMFLTAELVFVVLMLAAEKSKDTFMAPVGIGLALFVSELSGVYYTGGSLNPARSLGCAVAAREFPNYHWIYWLGPGMGAPLAAGYYRFIKWARYEEVNPGQDSAGINSERADMK